MDDELPAAVRRELIRLANRDGFNSTEVAALLEYSEYMNRITVLYDTDTSATALIEVWKESFDEEVDDVGQ